MVFHAIDASKENKIIVIRCDDTDVLVLLLYYFAKGSLAPTVFMHAGHSGKVTSKERFIPVHELVACMGKTVC